MVSRDILGRRALLATGLVALVLAPGFGTPVTPYAGEITSLDPGPFADFGVEENMLGPPEGFGAGAGSTDVYTLGVQGEVVLELDTKAWDGPGTDLIVFENPFIVAGSFWDAYVDALYVEVSSNGTDFARFPNDFDGPAGPYLSGSFQLGADVAYYDGFAGVLPVNAFPPTVEPLDVVKAGGDAFDLEDLAAHPLVLTGHLDLQKVTHIRLIDVEAGVNMDDAGDVIWDCGFPDFASADVDAVVAVNSVFNALPGRPEVELTLDPVSDLLTLTLFDPDGLGDIKFGLDSSFNGISFPFEGLLPAFVITQIDQTSVTLVTGPVPPTLDRMIFKVSAVDGGGLTRGDSIFLP